MASRTRQKEEARARRLAEERAHAERSRRQRRTRTLGGVVIAAVAVVAVLIAVSVGSSGGSSGLKKGKTESQVLGGLIAGIPQSGNVLGSPTAKVTVTEFGDLQCPICRDFALGSEQQLISNEVRSGKVKLAYRSLETATGNSPDPSVFGPQQAAAIAAGLQGHEWDYLLLFYHQQGQEGTGYVTQNFLDSLAQQIPGLNYNKWLSDSKNPNLVNQVTADEQFASGHGFNSTPTITITGPKGSAQPIVGSTDYGTLQGVIKQVK